MAKGKMVRVSDGHIAKARELLAATPDNRFGPGEAREVNDRELTDMAYSWLIGRMQADLFTKAEVNATVLRTVVDVLGEALGRKVNGMLEGDSILLSYEMDGERREVNVNVGAN